MLEDTLDEEDEAGVAFARDVVVEVAGLAVELDTELGFTTVDEDAGLLTEDVVLGLATAEDEFETFVF